jgi:hypothetical protein
MVYTVQNSLKVSLRKQATLKVSLHEPATPYYGNNNGNLSQSPLLFSLKAAKQEKKQDVAFRLLKYFFQGRGLFKL